MAVTAGSGVDLVLNSLSGELLHVSWKCVAPFGKMLEIGKRDFIGRGQLSMDVFESNRSFHGIDMAQMTVEKPEMCGKYVGNQFRPTLRGFKANNSLGSSNSSVGTLSKAPSSP